MARQPREWPTHGNAKNARDDAADSFRDILKEIRELRLLVEKGQVTRLDLMTTVSRIQEAGANGLFILVEQGAPTRRQP